MKTCKLYALLFSVNLISAFTNDQIMDRLNYLEDRQNSESKFRREDFGKLFQEIGNIKTMLQVSLDNKVKDSVEVKIPEQTHTMSEDKLKMLLYGFKEEKALNERFRREIPDIKRHVQDFMTETKQILANLQDTLKGIESLKQQAQQHHKETNEHFNHLEENNQKIEENVWSLKNQFEPIQLTETEKLDNITNDVKEIKVISELIQHNQKQSLEKIVASNNLSTSLAENLKSGSLFCTSRDNYTDVDAEKKNCSCPVSSGTNDIFTSPETKATTSPETPAELRKSCLDLSNHGYQSSGIYEIDIKPKWKVSVYCDMKTDGGGWTVFQRRQDGSVDFYRNWEDYRKGFGDLDGEFWLGNEYLNLMTDNNKTHELKVELGDHEGNQTYAKYSKFKVGPVETEYKLEVSGYSGNAGDSLLNSSSGYGPHNGMKFTTKDRDNDKNSINCAKRFQGAWWYNDCLDSNLNSIYHSQPKCVKRWTCIVWYDWKDADYSLNFTEMKFR